MTIASYNIHVELSSEETFSRFLFYFFLSGCLFYTVVCCQWHVREMNVQYVQKCLHTGPEIRAPNPKRPGNVQLGTKMDLSYYFTVQRCSLLVVAVALHDKRCLMGLLGSSWALHIIVNRPWTRLTV